MLKKMAVRHKGGKCSVCGYDKCLEALIFHHHDKKDFGIAFKGYTRSWQSVLKELNNCILVCSNCHAEIHAAQENAAPFGNGRVKNQVNSGKPTSVVRTG